MTLFSTSIPAKRQQLILNYLTENHSITIKEAASICNVSEATARRDIDDMAMDFILERTHGGAVLSKATVFEAINAEKMKLMVPEKIAIAKEATKYITDGSSIFLDSGTTTFFLAQELFVFKNLTVITNNLDIVHKVKLDSSSSLIATGGLRRDEYSVLLGNIAEETVSKLCADISFLGADAISPELGIYNSNIMEIGIKKQILECGRKKILLTDHSKFGQRALAKICELKEFDVVITDKNLNIEVKDAVEKSISNLIIV